MNIRELVSMLDTNKIPRIFYDIDPFEMGLNFFQIYRLKMIQGCYMPTNNFIYINENDQMNQDEYIFSVLFHELTHYIGKKFRPDIILGYVGITKELKIKEEYLAELTASKLMKYFNFETETTLKNHNSYFDILDNGMKFNYNRSLTEIELKQIDLESDNCMAYILNELFIPEKIKNIA